MNSASSFAAGTVFVVRTLFVFCSIAILSSLSAAEVKKRDLVGTWVGKDLEGSLVSYTFEKGGDAYVSNDGRVTLGGDEESTVTWKFFPSGSRAGLDLVWENKYGNRAESKFLVRVLDEDTIEIRSAGSSEERPSEFSETSDALQFVLKRL